MRIGVLADSHDHLTHLEGAVKKLREAGIDALIHAGDFVAPFTVPYLEKAGCPVYAVFGNNDGERVGLAARFKAIGAELHERPKELELGGHSLLVQHEPFGLDRLAGSPLYSLVIYGHTHQTDLRLPEQGAIVLNPGEVCGWLTGQASCALVDLARRRVDLIQV